LYIRGRAELARDDRSGASTVAAIESFQAAIARDPDYVLAHAGLAVASAKMRLFFATEEEVDTWHARAHQAAQRAQQLNPGLAETHEALAAVHRSTDFKWPETLEEGAQALKLNPKLDLPHTYRASAFSHLGLLDRVELETTAARENNPANGSEALRVEGVTAMWAGRFDAAVKLLEEARAASGSATDWNLANAYYYAGRPADAEKMLRQMSGSARSHRRAQATLASFLAARDEAGEATELIRVVTGASYKEHHVAYAVGAAYAQLRMPTEALEWLRAARSTGFLCYPWFERDPLLTPLKPNPEFRQFLDEFKQSWETTKARYETER
jgi:tetratricopeptide (TPR) repeat protein